MPLTPAQRDIDRKLHRIAQEADKDQYPTAIALARAIALQQLAEFAYQRANEVAFANATTISVYVMFARDIGILNPEFDPARPRADIRALDSFQRWLSNLSLRYLDANQASLERIRETLKKLLSDSPARLPTIDNTLDTLQSPAPKRNLHLSLRLLSSLRPQAIQLLTRRMVVINSVLRA